jgi:hypothetical protein
LFLCTADLRVLEPGRSHVHLPPAPLPVRRRHPDRETALSAAAHSTAGRAMTPDRWAHFQDRAWSGTEQAEVSEYVALLTEALGRAERKVAHLYRRGKDVISKLHDTQDVLRGCIAMLESDEVAITALQDSLAELENTLSPAIVYTPNGEAGDGQNHCAGCGEERDDCHWWSDCVVVLKKERDALIQSLLDKDGQARAEAERLRELLRAAPRAQHTGSCPMRLGWSGTICKGLNDECDCGADDHNARIDAALKERT